MEEDDNQKEWYSTKKRMSCLFSIVSIILFGRSIQDALWTKSSMSSAWDESTQHCLFERF